MGITTSTKKCNFEDIQNYINNKNGILINTLKSTNQDCLIKNTISIQNEEKMINGLLKKNNKFHIVIYGENCNDERIYEKYKQLIGLGFPNVFIYSGGMFEWLCLQDIYGDDEFPTTKKELDILKYKYKSSTNQLLLTS